MDLEPPTRVVCDSIGRPLTTTTDGSPPVEQRVLDCGVLVGDCVIVRWTVILPKQGPGYYREFVHPTPGVSGAGPQRIVSGQGGELYYTPNHYKTFVPLN